jgi:4-hydroxy-3-polyprenylbenzoate decarboxylase
LKKNDKHYPFRNLGEFIADLETAGELTRVKAPVSARLEISELTDRVSKTPGGGKALLFERVDDSSMPVLTNAFGSERRICMAMGVDSLDDIAARLREILNQSPPTTFAEKVRMAGTALGWTRYLPRSVRRSHAACQEVVLTGELVDLTKLPVLTCWPGDGGPFITFPVVFTKSLITGRRNAGMYRMQVYDRNTTGMHWHIHKDGAHFFHEYRRAGMKMEVVVAIGTDPAVTYAATAPLPRGIDEMLLAGFIRGRPVELVKAVTVDIEVPAEAEIVLEGYVDPAERRTEGPFGDHTGYYSLADEYPVFHVTAVTHRKTPVYSTTLVGRPPMEDCYLAKATERIFLPLLQTMFPEITDYWLPWEGVFHNVAVVAMENAYPGQARRVIHGLWGSGQMSFCKTLVVVDGETDLRGGRDLLRHILDAVELKRDLIITEGVLDVLDHAAPNALFGGKLGIDATGKGGPAPAKPVRVAADELLGALRKKDDGFLSCSVPLDGNQRPLILLKVAKGEGRRGPYFAELLLEGSLLPPRSVCVLFDESGDLADTATLLWKAFANVDPVRDVVTRGERAVIDASDKKGDFPGGRAWPDTIVMDPEVKARVDARLEELGLADIR